MRILGWLLLVGGFLLCASILWAAPGFLCLAFGLIFLQIAEQKRRRAKSAAAPFDQPEPQIEPPPLQELTRAAAPPKADEQERRKSPENATGVPSYDKQRWRALLSSDADISRLAAALEPYGQKYVDELAVAYLLLNDKDYLPMILQNIIASARRDSGIASDLPDKNTNADAVGMAFDGSRPVDDRVRDVRSGDADKSTSVDNVPGIDAGPEQERLSEPSGWKSSGHVEVSAVRETAAEATNLKAVVADAESNVSAAPEIAAEATGPKPPAVADAAAGPDEKGRTREVDAVDADNLTDILDRLSQVLTPKRE